jgi:hypothetical protein
MAFKSLGKPFVAVGKLRLKKPEPLLSAGQALKFRRSPDYDKIKEEVAAAFARLPASQRAQFSPSSTLPEQIVGVVLCWLGYYFQTQEDELGGRLRLGGGVVDYKVLAGAGYVIIRVQGDYWHSMKDRKLLDAVQWDRLHALGYRVWDAWESDLYMAWTENRIKQFVGDGVLNAS